MPKLYIIEIITYVQNQVVLVNINFYISFSIFVYLLIEKNAFYILEDRIELECRQLL